MEETQTHHASSRAEWILLLSFASLKLLVQLAGIQGYGYFRDEFYYLACSGQLDFGYVDHPPFSIWMLAGVRAVLGDSLVALRLIPALAGAAAVLLTGLIARRLGGGLIAQALAMSALLASPLYLALHHVYSMNSLDILFWALSAYLLVRILQGSPPQLWLLLGAVLGLGLQNKISLLWLGTGLLLGLLLTPQRRWLRTPWPWAAGAIALFVFSPHLIWQAAHGWPSLEFIRNATNFKMADISILDFLSGLVRSMNPVTVPIWLAGLYFFFARPEGKPYRMLGWIFVTVFLLLALSGSSRVSYMAPAYTWVLAAGGVAIGFWIEKGSRPWLRAGPVFALLAAGGLMMAPLGMPLLPVESYVSYSQALGIQPSTAERKELAELPQFYADMHGWDEIVSTVAKVYNSLSVADQKKAGIFTPNYGLAGAIDLLGSRMGLPPAISGHNNYWLWGPRHYTGEVMIMLGWSRQDLEEVFEVVGRVTVTRCSYCMPYENNNPIWLCRNMRRPLEEVWPELKHYD